MVEQVGLREDEPEDVVLLIVVQDPGSQDREEGTDAVFRESALDRRQKMAPNHPRVQPMLVSTPTAVQLASADRRVPRPPPSRPTACLAWVVGLALPRHSTDCHRVRCVGALSWDSLVGHHQSAGAPITRERPVRQEE
jgi:hypothetical protein